MIWRYRVHAGAEKRFIEHYGSAGSWARLFGRADGYLGTELLRGSSDEFLTIDTWESEEHHRAFLEAFAEEYAALDDECGALTESETFLGRYRSIGTARRGD